MIQLDHIGIAVADLPAIRKLFELLGLAVSRQEPVPDQGVITHFLPLKVAASGAHLELLEPTDPQGTVANFIRKRGPGVHHLSFSLGKDELGPLCDKLRQAGYRLTYDAPRAGAHGMRINFIHPASTGGVLVELMEKIA